jgi:serine/threonine protein kinase
VIPLDEDDGGPPLLENSIHQAGQEPLPGYRLVEPLGVGGFGEVWKCIVSGGLAKAIKFVEGAHENANGLLSAAAQELAALERVKAIRHPFILSIERVEVVNGVLMIVMELADRNLQAVLLECQVQGRPGIPREQLLGFLYEAAEALDEMNFTHGLQHLDVKPHNLFVIGTHVKVGDFGLVHSLGHTGENRSGGLTPLYAAPERYQQSMSRHSDQYSLAIVYQQMLTGTVPFTSPDAHQLRQQHLTGTPDLSALLAADRVVVARALAKDPEKRYPSCQDFVRALLQGSESLAAKTPSRQIMLNELRQRVRELDRTGRPAGRQTARPSAPQTPGAEAQGNKTVVTPANRVAGAPVQETRPSGVHPRAQAPSGGGGTSPPGPPGRAAASPSPPPQAFIKTCVQVAGYRFLECRGQNPLGEVWLVADGEDRQKLGYSLIPMSESSARTLTRLQALGHRALAPAEIFWSPAGRLVLVTDPVRKTLRAHFEQCQKEGLAGIPRAQLLTWLRIGAEALDELARDQALFHLGLSPINLLVEGQRLLLADFGLVPLVWMPTGQSAAALNQRYAAPELSANKVGPASDQYSLALIYAEMLTGIYPRLNQPSSRSSAHRRPIMPGRQTNPPGVVGGGPPKPPGMAKVVDLDFLPAGDRAILARALHDDPEQRFPSCTALFEALEAVPTTVTESVVSLPLVLPFECLLGKPMPPEADLPLPSHLLAKAIGSITGQVKVETYENVRFWKQSADLWECRCPIQPHMGLMRCKLESFRLHWQAKTVSEDDATFVYQILAESPAKKFWSRRKSQDVGLEVYIQVSETRASGHLSEALIRIRSLGEDQPEAHQTRRALVPRVFQSLRGVLQASVEQRTQQRWPWTAGLRVCPILPNLEVAEILEARARNISLGGMNFLVARPLPSEHIYIQMHEITAIAAHALLARVIRIVPAEGDKFEVGVTFQIDGPGVV